MAGGEGGAAGGGVMRKGHSLVMRRMVSGGGAGVGEGEGLGGGLAGGDLAEVEEDWPGMRLPVMVRVAVPMP